MVAGRGLIRRSFGNLERDTKTMHRTPICNPVSRFVLACALVPLLSAAGQERGSSPNIGASVEPSHGAITLSHLSASLQGAGVAAEVDHGWVHSADYPKPTIAKTTESGELGDADCWTVTFSGGAARPDLIYRLRSYNGAPFADLQLTLRNTGAKAITVQDLRPIEVAAANGIDLDGPPQDDRVLSDSFSEDRPAMKIHDLGGAPSLVHKGVGSQLVFNRRSGLSFFIGTLTSDKFLTILRVHVGRSAGSPAITSFEADDAGTTEFTKENSLRKSPPEDRVELSVTVGPGQELRSERLLVSLDSDYHRQLETYAHVIRDLHHARVTAPTPMGWWSWTAYYAKLNENTAYANAQWLDQHLKSLGYNFFHIDEGYSIGRGDYLTPDPKLFPGGMEALEHKIVALGLTPAIWTAPFEVSINSWVYKNHPEWLVKNAEGNPIQLPDAYAPNRERIYALDTTNPGAQDYLKMTYATMTKGWGIRYIKLDFMEDAGIEGVRYRPETSALEAQRTGLEVIRSAVGDSVYLDKDGCEMLNPVGIVDMGRISQDTGHEFRSIKDTATGFAARYYMNRNYFVADPDAFMVTAGKGSHTLSPDEARVSIALAAVSGGMFEIGDILLDFDSQPERLALVKNPVLIAMAQGGKASFPVDLMSYSPEAGQPSIFFLKGDAKTGGDILTVFNWTDSERTQSVSAASLGLEAGRSYKATDVFDASKPQAPLSDGLLLKLPPHSVQMLKIGE
jgi:alpha-galactosidase